jgi:hypothetical protein
MTSHYVKANQISQSMPGTAFAELMAAVLDRDKPFRFSAPGFSMTPFIRNGDVITIAPGRLRYGDVVAFINSSCGKLTVHRIVLILREGYLIKGDNASESDGCVPISSILGRVVRVEHCGRQLFLGLGIERTVIAFLSLRGWLMPVVRTLWGILKPIAGKRIR